MEKKELNTLNITISGFTGSGKSRMIHLLKKFLIENGFDVEQELSIDFSTQEKFDSVMEKDFDKVIGKIKETKKIKIKEQQLNKNLI